MIIPLKKSRQLRKYMIYSSIVLVLALIILLFAKQVGAILIILLLILLGCFCKIYKRFTGSISIGFEFITPITILFACKVGILFAIFSSIFMYIMAEFISGRFVPNALIFQIIGLAFMSVVAGVLYSMGVPFIPLAIALIIFRNIYLFITMVFIGGVDIFRGILGTVPNILINMFIVAKVGMFFVNALS